MSRKKRRRANIPPATLLRPRMESLVQADTLLSKEDAQIDRDLADLAEDVSESLFIKTLIRAYEAAPEAVRSRLDDFLPRWFAEREEIETLRVLAEDPSLPSALRAPVLVWLEATGMEIDRLRKTPSLAIEAYYFDDEEYLEGDLSQAFAVLLWYTDPRKRRAQAMTFLIDYNPPWNGSLKAISVSPRKSLNALRRQMQDVWKESWMEPEIVSFEQLKTVVLKALACNREAEISLSRDLIDARDLFEERLLALPDGPETPEFTMENFEFLAHHGEKPEEIMDFEHTIGRRVRTQDGEEILIIGTDWDDEVWDNPALEDGDR